MTSEALLACTAELLASHLLPLLQLRDLQALMQACHSLRSLVTAAPEAVWHQAAANSTSRRHPMLRSGSIHSYLQQQAQLQAAVASPDTWQTSSPRALPNSAVLSPDLKSVAEPLLQLPGLRVCQLRTSTQRTFVFPMPGWAATSPSRKLVGVLGWSPDSLRVCCLLEVTSAGAPRREDSSIQLCHLPDASVTSLSLGAPGDSLVTRAQAWVPDSSRLALSAFVIQPGHFEVMTIDASGAAVQAGSFACGCDLLTLPLSLCRDCAAQASSAHGDHAAAVEPLPALAAVPSQTRDQPQSRRVRGHACWDVASTDHGAAPCKAAWLAAPGARCSAVIP